MEIKITVIPQADGGQNTKTTVDGKMSLTSCLVALEMAKKQMMQLFIDYCDTHGIEDADKAFEFYGEIKVIELYK